MTTTVGSKNRRQAFSRIATAAALLSACLIAAPTEASAKKHGHHKHAPRGVAHGHYQRVPRVIAYDQRAHFTPYVAGRTYFAPHRHYHARYRFPVLVNGIVAYEPYSYCGDRLFISGAVTLPQLAIGVNFGSPGGLNIAGFYGAPLAYAPAYPPPYGHYHDHDDCDHH